MVTFQVIWFEKLQKTIQIERLEIMGLVKTVTFSFMNAIIVTDAFVSELAMRVCFTHN